MKRIFLLAIALLILGSVGLFAQYTYDFEFDVICSSDFSFVLETRPHSAYPWQTITPPTGNYLYSQLIRHSIDAPPSISAIRITATSPGGSYQEIHTVSIYGVNYFLIDLRTFLDPTPPNPMGGGE